MSKVARVTTEGNVCVLQADTLHNDGKHLHVFKTRTLSNDKVDEELIGMFKLSEVKMAYITESKKD